MSEATSDQPPASLQSLGCLPKLVLGCLLFLECAGLPLLRLILFMLLGWAWFLYKTLPQVSVSWAFVASGVVLTALTASLLHVGVRRWSPPDIHCRWRFRHSLGSLLLAALLSGGGTAFVEAVHQPLRLFAGNHPLIDHIQLGSPRHGVSIFELRNIGVGTSDLISHDGRLPASTVDRWGTPQHSWITMLLPYIDYAALYRQIDRSRPWNAPENHRNFAYHLRVLRHPALRRLEKNTEGLAMTPYSANGRVVGLGRRLSRDEITDGEANTILAGEIAGGFPAWGDPLNFRDPVQGLGGDPNGFGSAFGNRVNMLFADGSARSLNPNIDPRVLKALSTPDGGDRSLAEEWLQEQD